MVHLLREELYSHFFTQIEILKCRLTTNLAVFGGGALKVIKCHVIVYDSYFNLNAANDVAGVIHDHANDHSVINITKNQFYSNRALKQGDGGVLRASYLTNITLIESVFQNNSAQQNGGVVSMGKIYNLIIVQCQFSSNRAVQGGVISATFYCKVTIFDSGFNNNAAYECGGVVSILEETVLNIHSSFFRECTAKIGGILTQ